MRAPFPGLVDIQKFAKRILDQWNVFEALRIMECCIRPWPQRTLQPISNRHFKPSFRSIHNFHGNITVGQFAQQILGLPPCNFHFKGSLVAHSTRSWSPGQVVVRITSKKSFPVITAKRNGDMSSRQTRYSHRRKRRTVKKGLVELAGEKSVSAQLVINLHLRAEMLRAKMPRNRLSVMRLSTGYDGDFVFILCSGVADWPPGYKDSDNCRQGNRP
jgi:hypothetical protein